MVENKKNVEEESLSEIVRAGWDSGMIAWNNPSVSTVINAVDETDFERLGAVGKVLKEQLAFMQYPQFQTYANIPNIRKTFSDFERGYRAVSKHEIGHRFCPYDKITAFFLARQAERGLQEAASKNPKNLAPEVMNLFTDTCINTKLVRAGDEDLPWAYQELSNDAKRQKSALWRVYVQSCEKLWNTQLLSSSVVLSDKEKIAVKEIEQLFGNKNPFEKSWWEQGIKEYAKILAPFLQSDENVQGAQSFDSSGAGAIPSTEEVKDLLGEIARRLAKPGPNGLPTNDDALKEFRSVLAGLGEGDPVKASVVFYENLANRYSVKFATQPYGRPRASPFSLQKWSSSDPLEDLDVQQTLVTSGVVVPGVTTQKWLSRTTSVKGGEQECVQTLDILIDSSGSMPNPVETISLPVLAGFVAARRAKRQGVRVVNYWNDVIEVPRTHDLANIYNTLVVYHANGGTVFPVAQLLGNPAEDPRLSLIITDTFFANTEEAVSAIKQFCGRNKQNRVTIYAITNLPNADELVSAGAECIHGTTPNIFKHILGKTEKTYVKK